jgi:hypothetical protein
MVLSDIVIIAQWTKPTLYYKNGNSWVEFDKGYEKLLSNWEEKNVATLLENGRAYRRED